MKIESSSHMKPEEKAAERICSGVGEMFGEESMTAQIIAEEFKEERALHKEVLAELMADAPFFNLGGVPQMRLEAIIAMANGVRI